MSLQARILSALDLVRDRLAQMARTVGPAGDVLAEHAKGGKLLRARFVLLTASLGSREPNPAAIGRAVTIELIHAGALCHDDLVDASPVRRGRPTVWRELGPRAAALGGLYLVVRAAETLAAESATVRRTVARALRDVARGQTDEGWDHRARNVSIPAYLRRIYGKTGALYELAAWLGAEGGRLPPSAVDQVARYGAHAGVAFQLADDVRDFRGGPAFGREAGTDVREGVYTLPILLTLAGRFAGALDLRRLLARGQTSQVAVLLERNGALTATAHMARRRVDRAVARLRRLPASEARVELESLARVMGRVAATSRADARRAHSRPAPPSWRPPLAVALGAARSDDGSIPARLSPTRLRGVPADALAVAATMVQLANGLPRSMHRSVTPTTRAAVGTLDLVLAELLAVTAPMSPRTARVLCAALCDVLRTSWKACVHPAGRVGGRPVAITVSTRSRHLPPTTARPGSRGPDRRSVRPPASV
jgi:geranylgeranyl pyrophosphate synthase